MLISSSTKAWNCILPSTAWEDGLPPRHCSNKSATVKIVVSRQYLSKLRVPSCSRKDETVNRHAPARSQQDRSASVAFAPFGDWAVSFITPSKLLLEPCRVSFKDGQKQTGCGKARVWPRRVRHGKTPLNGHWPIVGIIAITTRVVVSFIIRCLLKIRKPAHFLLHKKIVRDASPQSNVFGDSVFQLRVDRHSDALGNVYARNVKPLAKPNALDRVAQPGHEPKDVGS